MQNFLNPVFKFFLVGITILTFSCTTEMEKYYEVPDWLVGNAYEFLEKQGNYTLFMQAIEMAGYKDLVDGKGIITVMAPSDEAFNAYLAQKGYSSLSDIPINELKKLVGYHLVYYAFGKDRFANYQPNGSGNENPLEKGLYYKHRTKALGETTTEYDKVLERNVKIFHKELFIPVLSEYLFQTKSIDPTSNYEYFFEDSKWSGDNGGFNIASAVVDTTNADYAVVTDNGYLYEIDRVLEPLETIHQSLRNQGNFSEFLTLYDKFSDFWYDEEATKNYGNGDSLFIHKHIDLPQIASEWPYNGEEGLADYANLAALSKDAFTVFVPTNEAIDDFYNKYWAPNYSSIDSIYWMQIRYLLDNHVYSGSLVFPEEITKEEIKTTYGTTISFDPEADVDIKQICANGAYYGLNKVQVPSMFESVTSPALSNPNYRMFMYMLDASGMILPLSNNTINYTVFYPSDDVFIKSGYYDSDIRYYDPNEKSYSDDAIQILDGLWGTMSSGTMGSIIDDHVATDVLTVIDGISVYKTRNSLNYIYVKEDSVSTTRMYNENAGFAALSPIDGDWSNGQAFNTDTLLLQNNIPFKAEIPSADEYAYLKDYEYFSTLLTKAGLLQFLNPLDFIVDDYLVFAPTNEVIRQDSLNGHIIPSDPDSLAEYLKYYFVPLSANNLSDFLFPGTGVSYELSTYQMVEGEYTKFSIADDGTNLEITSPTGNAKVLSKIPKVYSDGAAYLIDGLIQP